MSKEALKEALKEFALKQFEKYAIEIPEHIVDGFRLYLTDGIEPGSFCTAVLSNNLKEAAGRADYINQANLSKIALFMVWGMPADSQGSPEKVKAWVAHNGLNGLGENKDVGAEND